MAFLSDKIVVDLQQRDIPSHNTGAAPAWHSNDSISSFQPPAAVRLNLAVVLYDTAPYVQPSGDRQMPPHAMRYG